MSTLNVSNKKDLVRQRDEIRNAQESETVSTYINSLEEQLNKAKDEGEPLVAKVVVQSEQISKMLSSAYKAQGFYVSSEISPMNKFNYSVIIAESEEVYKIWRLKSTSAIVDEGVLAVLKKIT